MEFIGITATGWTAILVTLSMAILTVMMFVLGKERIHYVWGWFCLIVTIWIGAFYGAVIAKNVEMAEFWWRISYVGVILIPFGFMHFVIEFTNILNIKKIKYPLLGFLYFIALGFIFLDLKTNLIVSGVEFLFDEFYYGKPGLVHPYFMILYVSMVAFAFYLVYRQYKNKKEDKRFRQQVVYFFIANFMAFVGGSLNFLPIYGIKVSPISNISVALGAGLISYAILRYRLFNARVVTAQFLTFILVSFSLVRLIVADSIQWIIFDISLLVVTLFVGIGLIRSVRQEVEQREKLQLLTKQLESANEKLKELDHMKSEFLSFASHQIKAPLAAIKGFATLIYDGTYGQSSEKVNEAAHKIKDSADRMIQLVGDFLNVRKIEEGKMVYKKERLDAIKIIQSIFEELKLLAKNKGLEFTLESIAESGWINADPQNIRQVFQNLIENAIKYTETGFVKVRTESIAGKFIFSVSDSGHGISKELLPHLFEEFRRDALSTGKIEGTGLGLFIAHQITIDHGGEIWVESDGLGKGSKFLVKLPLA